MTFKAPVRPTTGRSYLSQSQSEVPTSFGRAVLTTERHPENNQPVTSQPIKQQHRQRKSQLSSAAKPVKSSEQSGGSATPRSERRKKRVRLAETSLTTSSSSGSSVHDLQRSRSQSSCKIAGGSISSTSQTSRSDEETSEESEDSEADTAAEVESRFDYEDDEDNGSVGQKSFWQVFQEEEDIDCSGCGRFWTCRCRCWRERSCPPGSCSCCVCQKGGRSHPPPHPPHPPLPQVSNGHGQMQDTVVAISSSAVAEADLIVDSLAAVESSCQEATGCSCSGCCRTLCSPCVGAYRWISDIRAQCCAMVEFRENGRHAIDFFY